MRRIAIALFATMATALATPALAQGLYIGAGPGGIGIGIGSDYHGDGYGHRYRNYEGAYRYASECRWVTIETRSGLRQVRRCY